MKIAITFDFDYSRRRAIGHANGHGAPAERDEIQAWIVETIDAQLAPLIADVEAATQELHRIAAQKTRGETD